MMKLNEVMSPLQAAENDINFDVIPRRQTERRQKSHSAYIKTQTLSPETGLQEAKQENSSSVLKGIVDRRREERRKSRPAAFLSVEEIIRLRRK